MDKGLGSKLARMAGTGAIALVTLILNGTPAKAGDYVAAQCAPGLNASTEARFSSSSNHFKGIQECGRNAPGVQIRHQLAAGETRHRPSPIRRVGLDSATRQRGLST